MIPKKLFQFINKIIPHNWGFQWVGRTRSSGKNGVGYLSFILRDTGKITYADGVFVTAYDIHMRQRECLGIWFDKLNPLHKFTYKKINAKINDVLEKAQKTSRLTGGIGKEIPLYSYTLTYLFKENTKDFIRGWHGVRKNAFYLSDVFLEHTFNNGDWITHKDIYWPQKFNFNLNPTFQKLYRKAGYSITDNSSNLDYTLYSSKVTHHKLRKSRKSHTRRHKINGHKHRYTHKNY